MRSQRKPTIKDVAALANISIASVSRSLNNKGHLSKEKAKTIREAVEILNYVPNTAERTARTKKAK